MLNADIVCKIKLQNNGSGNNIQVYIYCMFSLALSIYPKLLHISLKVYTYIYVCCVIKIQIKKRIS